MANAKVDEFINVQFSVTPCRTRILMRPTSVVQRLSAWLSFGARTRRYREVEIAGWKMEFDLTNDWVEREISYDLNWQAISRTEVNGADELDWRDISRFALEPTLITRAEFEEDWKKLNP